MKIFKISKCFYVTIFLLFFVVMCLFTACDNNDDLSRNDYLIVSSTAERSDTITKLFCNISGGLDTLYVFSNTDYEVAYQQDHDAVYQQGDKFEEWIKIISEEEMPEIGATRYIFEIMPMEDFNYMRRSSSLLFTNKEKYLGHFINLNQGFYTRLEEDFSWLRYGSASPLQEQQETLLTDWNIAERERGWTTSEIGEYVFTYGKNGYIKVGSETKSGDLITPYMTGAARDSAFLVTLNAVAYSSSLNKLDNNKLTVNILSGGEFLDGTTSKTFELNYYDPHDDELETNMWEDAGIEFYVITGKDNAISGTTRFQFVSGETGSAGSVEKDGSRVFIDDITVYLVNREYYYLVSDYWPDYKIN